MLSVRGRIEQSFSSPDELSDLATKLASYNAHLGDEIGKMERDLAEQTTNRHYQYTTEGELTDSAAKTKIKAELAIPTAEQKKLKIMHRDASTQISTIQSRLKVLADERRNG
jgi:hypothetical protein